ncbi:hypothetical protein N7491_006208 [Penicillium cf. griseofulvum]|nr:hypothetical protein N7491_006208 [Penicillium cf. griseofulvum]
MSVGKRTKSNGRKSFFVSPTLSGSCDLDLRPEFLQTSHFLMPSSLALTPGLGSFLKCLKTNPIDTSIETLISRAEMVVGNIVRRVLGLIRDEAEDDRDAEFALSDIGSESQPQTPRAYDDPLAPSDLYVQPSLPSRTRELTSQHPGSLLSKRTPPGHGPSKDVRAEVLEGIGEIIDELGQVDDQIAAYALDHIHSNEIILTHTSSTTVQKFLLKAATKRKFTVIHAESYPNNHEATHATVSGSASDDDYLGLEAFQKPLIEHGITVILIPDSAVFAIMSRVNKVILGTHSVLANGGLVAAAGTRVIARAAKVHQTPVVVVSGVYKLSPVYPFDFDSLIEYGDPSKVLSYEEGDLVDLVDVQNPIYDYVPAELVDLYITNIGGHAPSYLYRIVSDHYRKEDISF